MSDLCWLTAAELQNGYGSKTISPREATQAALERIESLNDRFGAYCLVDHDAALKAAAASEARWLKGEPLGPADGIPSSVKDLVLAKGWPCRRGSPLGDVAPSATDAPAVASLRAGGAVLLGKTTTPDFGWKAVTDNSLGDIARNPFDPDKSAGGSSGGAAVAAALAMGVWHIGTDGGGSIRIPSSFCGIVGLKPTFGRVPALPLSPFGSVAHLGPMTRSVGDCVSMLEVMSRSEPRDWHHFPSAFSWLSDLPSSVAGMRIAASRNLGCLEVDDEIAKCFEQSVALLRDIGAKVDEVDPLMGNCLELFEVHWCAGAANLVATLDPARLDDLDPGLLEIARLGEAISAAKLRQSAIERGRLGEAMQGFFQDYDLLATPSTTLPAFEAGKEVPEASGLQRWYQWAGFSYPFNLTQQPAISLPAGRTSKGLPIGLQLVAGKYREVGLLGAATAIEKAGLRFSPPAVG